MSVALLSIHQKAVRKVLFVKFPPVLHLQLMRFQYDMYSEGHSKINDRCSLIRII